MNFSIRHFDELPSTNTTALELASKGEPEGLVIVADYQSAGRGKPGNEWVSPKGRNLLFSLLIRPEISAHEAPMMTQTACRSVASVLKEKYGLDCDFKRPNDLMVNGKKICGTLVESSSLASGKVEAMVIGIGLNVNALRDETIETGTSMQIETGNLFNTEELLHDLLEQLKKDLKDVCHSRS